MVKFITPPDEINSTLHKLISDARKPIGIVIAISRLQRQGCLAIKNGNDADLKYAYKHSYLKRRWGEIMRRNLAKLNSEYRSVMATGTKSPIVVRFK